MPWQDRLRPGDVGIGDLLPASPDDERLVGFVTLDGDDAVTDWFQPRTDTENEDAGPRIEEELPSPGRSRVLSAFGRYDTAERWYESDHGPRTLPRALRGRARVAAFVPRLAVTPHRSRRARGRGMLRASCLRGSCSTSILGAT